MLVVMVTVGGVTVAVVHVVEVVVMGDRFVTAIGSVDVFAVIFMGRVIGVAHGRNLPVLGVGYRPTPSQRGV